ncbi:MAG: hypothetical protein ABIE22_04295 [archaeon]
MKKEAAVPTLAIPILALVLLPFLPSKKLDFSKAHAQESEHKVMAVSFPKPGVDYATHGTFKHGGMNPPRMDKEPIYWRFMDPAPTGGKFIILQDYKHVTPQTEVRTLPDGTEYTEEFVGSPVELTGEGYFNFKTFSKSDTEYGDTTFFNPTLIEDSTTPFVQFHYPPQGAERVRLDEEIEIRIRDSILGSEDEIGKDFAGVNPSSLQIAINGTNVTNSASIGGNCLETTVRIPIQASGVFEEANWPLGYGTVVVTASYGDNKLPTNTGEVAYMFQLHVTPPSKPDWGLGPIGSSIFGKFDEFLSRLKNSFKEYLASAHLTTTSLF